MAEKATAFVLDDQEPTRWIVLDTMFTLVHVLNRAHSTDPATLATIDRLQALSTERQDHPISCAMALEIAVTTPVASFFVAQALVRWNEGGRESVSMLDAMLRARWPDALSGSETGEGRVVELCSRIAVELAGLDVPASEDTERVNELRVALASLSEHLLDRGDSACAVKCVLSAANVASLLSPAASAAALEELLPLASRTSEEQTLLSISIHRAQALANASQTDPSRRFDAFDALEGVIRRLPTFEASVRKSAAAVCRHWTGALSYLHPLRPLVELALSPDERVPPEARSLDVPSPLQTIWSKAPDDWDAWVQRIGSLAMDVENARLALQVPVSDRFAETTWDRWSIDHPRLRRAVPHGRSVLRERELDDILLVLGHEVTHVYSLAGFVGRACLALRWAIFENEAYLWTLVHKDEAKRDPAAFGRLPGPVPLGPPDLIGLAVTQRSVELERKIQILEATWTPWFEGLAVFAELSADPSTNDDSYSSIWGTLLNLIDFDVRRAVRERGIDPKEAVREAYREVEGIYSGAIRRAGPYRLRAYLERYGPKYLSGYVAVRAIVARWRRSIGRPSTGGELIAALLNLTRASGPEYLPDVSAPIERFREEALERHVAWVRALARLDGDRLSELIADFDRGAQDTAEWRLVQGGLVREPVDAGFQAREGERFADLVARCHSSASDAEEVGSRLRRQSALMTQVIRMVLDVLRTSTKIPHLFDASTAPFALSHLLTLPLGRCDCPFWIVPEERTFICLLRTRETDVDGGRPAYDLVLVVRPDGAVFDELLATVERVRASRMTVTRVTDLTAGAGGSATGRSFLVFELDEWIHIQPRGLLMGATEVPPHVPALIRARLQPPPAARQMSGLASTDHPCARRTREWITSGDSPGFVDPRTGIDAGAWALTVLSEAEAVASGVSDSDRRRIDLAVLRATLGPDANVEALVDKGVDALVDGDSALTSRWVRFLLDSGIRPVTDEEGAAGLAQELGVRGWRIVEHGPQGWDVVPAEID